MILFLGFLIITSSILSQTYTGEGLTLIKTSNTTYTAKWTDYNNNVVTKYLTYSGETFTDFDMKNAVAYKYTIKNSTSYFLIGNQSMCIMANNCFIVKFYNELGSLYWDASVTN